MPESPVELIRRWVAAFNERDFTTLAAIDHPEIAWQTSREDPDATTHRGHDALRRYLEGYFETFPDLQIEIKECFELDDGRVFTTSRFFGHSASGVPMEWPLTTLSSLEQGQVKDVEEYFDRDEAAKVAGIRKR